MTYQRVPSRPSESSYDVVIVGGQPPGRRSPGTLDLSALSYRRIPDNEPLTERAMI